MEKAQEGPLHDVRSINPHHPRSYPAGRRRHRAPGRRRRHGHAHPARNVVRRASTGPHLDYRIWKNGTPIDPLKVPQEPAEPIAKENRATFEFVRDRIAAELNGEVKDEERITQLDSLVIPQAPAASAPAGETSAGETTAAK